MYSYILDTNVFIQAKNMYYGFDFCPAFWDWLILQNNNGKVASIRMVADELNKGSDELKKWAAKRGDGFFLKQDDSIDSALIKVGNYVQKSSKYPAPAIFNFLQKADSRLVSHVYAHGGAVVTYEIPDNSTKKIKIPNVCKGLGLSCINTYEMLRRENARFVLDTDSS